MAGVKVPKLVGITGYAQHGKDSIAAVLGDFGFLRVGFADQLKDMALRLDPVIPYDSASWDRLSAIVQREGWNEAKKLPEVRRLLRSLGTDCVREMIGEDAWIQALAKKHHLYAPEPSPYMIVPNRKIVVADVRFRNEAAWIRRLGGEVWRVVRTVDGELYDGGVPHDAESERDVPSIWVELEIRNDLDLDSLQRKVRNYLIAAKAVSEYPTTMTIGDAVLHDVMGEDEP